MRRALLGRKITVAAFASLGVVASLTALSGPADARGRRHFARSSAPAYSPPFAAMVVDTNTGRVLYAKNENELRHPASITKVMTLYMLFEQLERGKLSLDDEIQVSAHAASMAPTKLGLRPGSTIKVDSAIRAIVTKSANDMAAAVAEAIGGTEDRFAEMMTAKARALGMSRTTYVNASGLPDEEQVTTAKDLIVLGRAIQEKFPKYYGYFSTPSFRYGGSFMRNHNNLLGRVEGMDGIKTGYTRASGFNLLTSVKRDGRRIVGVVLGGRSAGVRDNIMAGLITENIRLASATRTAPMLAEREPEEAPRRPMATTRWEAPVREAKADIKPEPKPEPVVAPGKPLQLASIAVAPPMPEKPRPAVVSSGKTGDDLTPTASIGPAKRVVLDGSTNARPVTAAMTGTTPSSTPNMRWVAGPSGLPSRPTLAKQEIVAPAHRAPETKMAKAEPPTLTKVDAGRPSAAKRGVMIQIGATDDADKAHSLLARAKSQGKGALASAQPFTEKVQKGRETLYRARFAGLAEDQAEAACKSLKRSGFACFTTKD
jgi:D-alanyl-D-alanine carboxypeptidase